MTNQTDRIGKFEIIERLGEGGMGEVFLARDTIIGREVALKVIRRASLLPPDGPGRFLRETQAAGRLSHPNLVTIHEFGEKGGVLFQAMEFVAGDDLGQLFQDQALTPKEVLELLAQVCDGLAHAHQHGLLHRNLKPSNVRIGSVSGRSAAKILDTGMSRTPGNDPASLAAHLATLRFSAPETFQAGKLDGRADLFSVGVIAYESLTGTRPFDGDAPAAIAQRVLHEEPAPLEPGQFPDISPAIVDILQRAMAKDPAKRFASAELLAASFRAARNPGWTEDLEAPLAANPAKPFLIPAAASEHRPPRSHTSLAWTSALTTLVVLGAGAAIWQRTRRRSLRMPAPAPQTQVAAVPSLIMPKPPEPPAPVPAPAPQVAAPQAPALPGSNAAKARYGTLDEAAAALEKDPQGALTYLDQAVTAQPDNERAFALRIVALYSLQRYPACSKAIKEARDAGHPLWPMALKNPPLRKILEQDAKDPHLPRRKPATPAPGTTPAPAPAPAAAAETPAG